MLTSRYLAIVNPAAAGGKTRKPLGPALEKLKSAGVEVEVRETSASGHACEIARDAWREGYRKFVSVGGDGTSYEIVNGLYPLNEGSEKPTLAFLPLGTGNSFLRDFSDRGVDYAMESLIAGRSRPCDVLRLTHKSGVLYYINILSIGFSADVATLRARRFSHWGEVGYQTAIFLCLARFRRRPWSRRAVRKRRAPPPEPFRRSSGRRRAFRRLKKNRGARREAAMLARWR